MLKINFLKNLHVCSTSTSLTSIQLQKHVVLSIVFSYSFCNSYWIQKSFVGLIRNRLVSCTPLDLTAGYICADVNLDGFVTSLGGGELGTRPTWGDLNIREG